MENHEDDKLKDKTGEGEGASEQKPPVELAGQTPPASTPDEANRLVEQLQRERDEYLDLLRRSRAEFSNYRKRVERDMEDLRHRAVGDFAKELLPVLDDLDRAFAAVEKEHDTEAFLVGIRLVSQKLHKVLEEAGMTSVHPEGEQFDPNYHEAVMVEEHDKLEPGTVSEVLRKGYAMKGKSLRPAQVKVVKAPQPGPKPDQDGSDDKTEKEPGE